MKEEIYIYVLKDPRDNKVRYVGKTINMTNRYSRHLDDIKSKKSNKKINWLKSLNKLGLKPIMEEIDFVDYSCFDYWETFYIDLFKSWGFDLTNGTKGEDGNSQWQIKHEQTTKDKIGLAHRGKPKSEDHKKAMSIAARNRKPRASFKGKRKLVSYINKPVYQVNFEGIVLKKWDNVVIIIDSLFKGKDYCGLLHYHARSKGKKIYQGFYWLYCEDLIKQYEIGDKIEEIQFKCKYKKTIAINRETKQKLVFETKREASRFFKVSETSISFYISGRLQHKDYEFSLVSNTN